MSSYHVFFRWLFVIEYESPKPHVILEAVSVHWIGLYSRGWCGLSCVRYNMVVLQINGGNLLRIINYQWITSVSVKIRFRIEFYCLKRLQCHFMLGARRSKAEISCSSIPLLCGFKLYFIYSRIVAIVYPMRYNTWYGKGNKCNEPF